MHYKTLLPLEKVILTPNPSLVISQNISNRVYFDDPRFKNIASDDSLFIRTGYMGNWGILYDVISEDFNHTGINSRKGLSEIFNQGKHSESLLLFYLRAIDLERKSDLLDVEEFDKKPFSDSLIHIWRSNSGSLEVEANEETYLSNCQSEEWYKQNYKDYVLPFIQRFNRKDVPLKEMFKGLSEMASKASKD